MPQFDFYYFSGQNFWFLLSFFPLYFFISYLYLSTFSMLLKMRIKLQDLYRLKNEKQEIKPINLFSSFFKKVTPLWYKSWIYANCHSVPKEQFILLPSILYNYITTLCLFI